MGKRGPAKTPTAMLQLRGNPNITTRPDTDVEVCNDLPSAPAHITGYALEAWNYYGAMIVHRGVMAETDGMAFVGLCQSWKRYMEADEEMTAKGADYMDANGVVREYPHVKRRDRAESSWRKWLAEFGLTPASRPDVPREPKKQKALGDRY